MLPHAILVHGMAGLGKQHFAQVVTAGLLCEKPRSDGVACGQCHGCHLLQIKSHPDFRLITWQGTGRIIKVDQIRAVKDFLAVSSHYGGHRMVIITAAETMNRAAANALLKMLEEPGEGTLIFLLCHHLSLLAATVKSRCQSLSFCPVDPVEIKTWLQTIQTQTVDIDLLVSLSQGAPLQALAWADDDQLQQRRQMLDGLIAFIEYRMDPINLAKDYLSFELDDIINCLSCWVLDSIKIYYGIHQSELINTDSLKAINAFNQRITIHRLFSFLQKLITVKQHVLQGIPLNKQLLLEDLLGSL